MQSTDDTSRRQCDKCEHAQNKIYFNARHQFNISLATVKRVSLFFDFTDVIRLELG